MSGKPMLIIGPEHYARLASHPALDGLVTLRKAREVPREPDPVDNAQRPRGPSHPTSPRQRGGR